MPKTYSLHTYFFVVAILGLLIGWRTDRLHFTSQVELLEKKLSLSNPDYRIRRESLEKIAKDLDVKTAPDQLPHLLYALSDPDPVVRSRALDILRTLRLGARTMNWNPDASNSQPEFAFWVGAINSARQHSDNWETIKLNIERLNQGPPDSPDPFD